MAMYKAYKLRAGLDGRCAAGPIIMIGRREPVDGTKIDPERVGRAAGAVPTANQYFVAVRRAGGPGRLYNSDCGELRREELNLRPAINGPRTAGAARAARADQLKFYSRYDIPVQFN
ncbi:hypothetical protein EVAR_9030_1 [Eumeta japonica]|uniref:Uncharacterized protein n=1 Tax=Eumeta variegata TaxID=151549 RepID=A0A4C1TW88_EUMVA|nr:hypothetical protein EVAR_9030_1 [Eumeta japonica]